jgi:hypothetical protein
LPALCAAAWRKLRLGLRLVCWEVAVRILLAIIIYDESKARKHVLEESFCEEEQKNLVISSEAGCH